MTKEIEYKYEFDTTWRGRLLGCFFGLFILELVFHLIQWRYPQSTFTVSLQEARPIYFLLSTAAPAFIFGFFSIKLEGKIIHLRYFWKAKKAWTAIPLAIGLQTLLLSRLLPVPTGYISPFAIAFFAYTIGCLVSNKKAEETLEKGGAATPPQKQKFFTLKMTEPETILKVLEVFYPARHHRSAYFEPHCLKCGKTIPLNSCNAQADRVPCDACRAEIPFRRIFRQEYLNVLLAENNIPQARIQESEKGRTLTLRAPEIAPMLAWIPAVIFGGFCGVIGRDLPVPIPLLLTLLPFLLPLLNICFRIRLTDDGGRITMFNGIGNLGKKQIFERKDLVSVAVAEKRNRGKDENTGECFLVLEFKDGGVINTRSVPDELLYRMAAFFCCGPNWRFQDAMLQEKAKYSKNKKENRYCPHCMKKLPQSDYNVRTGSAFCRSCCRYADFGFYACSSSGFSSWKSHRLKEVAGGLRFSISHIRIGCLALTLPFLCIGGIALTAIAGELIDSFQPIFLIAVALVATVPTVFIFVICSFGGKYYSVTKCNGEVRLFSWIALYFKFCRFRKDELTGIHLWHVHFLGTKTAFLQFVLESGRSIRWGYGCDESELEELAIFILRSDSVDRQIELYDEEVSMWNAYVQSGNAAKDWERMEKNL